MIFILPVNSKNVSRYVLHPLTAYEISLYFSEPFKLHENIFWQSILINTVSICIYIGVNLYHSMPIWMKKKIFWRALLSVDLVSEQGRRIPGHFQMSLCTWFAVVQIYVFMLIFIVCIVIYMCQCSSSLRHQAMITVHICLCLDIKKPNIYSVLLYGTNYI